MTTKTAYRSPIRLSSHDAVRENELPTALLNSSPAAWPFHRTIYEQKGLLQFLEEGVFMEEQMSPASFLRYNPAFVQFISLPFAHSFCLATNEALKKENDFAGINQLMDYASFVLPEHHPIAFEPINAYLQTLLLKLQPLSWEQFVQDESILDFLFSTEWIRFFNALPALCDEARQNLIRAVLQLLKRFRLDASDAYLKALCEKLQQLKTTASLQQALQEYKKSFTLPKAPLKPPVKTVNRSLFYYTGGGILLTGALLFLLLPSKAKRPPQAEDKYMDAVETVSASDQLNSSINERNLKAFLYQANRQENKGTKAQLQTGDNPIPGVTRSPAQDGNSTLTIKNETASDAMLLYFGSDNPLVSKQSRLVAVYIRKGDTYRTHFQPDFGRFNFILGNGWVELFTPVPFPFYQGNVPDKLPANTYYKADDYWLINRFFRQARLTQPFLNHDITITNIEQKTALNANTPVFTLLNEKKGKKLYSDAGSVELSLLEEGGDITIKAQSSLYVYKSPPTFDPMAVQ